MTAKHVLAIFVLVGMFVLSMQYPAYADEDSEGEIAFLKNYLKYRLMRDQYKNQVKRGSCIPLGSTGCEANNGKCCREGNPYTGTMRKCVNVGGFSAPVYKCEEA